MDKYLPGERLEEQIYRYLNRVLVPDLLGLDSDRAKVYMRKAYYSAERGSDIIVDVALEIHLKGADSPSIIWVWECKDYSGRVPIADVEEFDAKLRQIGEHNTKGTLVTRNGFQESAINFAKSRKIGLARILSEHQVIMRFYMGGPERVQKALEVMTIGDEESSDYGFGGLTVAGEYAAFRHVLPFMARQLFTLIPRIPPSRCQCCGKGNVSKALLIEQRIQPANPDTVSQSPWLDPDSKVYDPLSVAPALTVYYMCMVCASIIMGIPYGAYSIGLMITLIGTILTAILSTMVNMNVKIVTIALTGAVLLGLAYRGYIILCSTLARRRMGRYLELPSTGLMFVKDLAYCLFKRHMRTYRTYLYLCDKMTIRGANFRVMKWFE